MMLDIGLFKTSKLLNIYFQISISMVTIADLFESKWIELSSLGRFLSAFDNGLIVPRSTLTNLLWPIFCHYTRQKNQKNYLKAKQLLSNLGIKVVVHVFTFRWILYMYMYNVYLAQMLLGIKRPNTSYVACYNCLPEMGWCNLQCVILFRGINQTEIIQFNNRTAFNFIVACYLFDQARSWI